MKSSTDVVHLLNQYQSQSSNSTAAFEKLLQSFKPSIKRFASNYPKFWYEDFVQEGSLGLHKALTTFPLTSDRSKFASYAIAAIQSKMIDFYRSTIGKSCIEETSVNENWEIESNKKLLYINPYTVENEDEEYYYSLLDMPSPIDYVTSISMDIDVKYHFTKQALQKNGFSINEINVFELYFIEDLKSTEIAKYLSLSQGQVSKLVHKVKQKVQDRFNS